MEITKEFLEKSPLYIAEVGQNHQGSLDYILEYIDVFSRAGANAIKFQKRDNKFLFDETKLQEPYDHENSFGSTYGQHREHLELKTDWLGKIKDACTRNNVLFMCTAFDEQSLEILLEYEVDILKVASFDLGNIPLLKKVAASNKPVIFSTGGGNFDHIDASIQALEDANQIGVLHCVSQYPCPPEILGLNGICDLIARYPDIPVGLSDHFSGTLSGPIGYMKGARIFEKHVTLNRAWKGTDHSFALEANGFKNFVRDIKRVPLMEPVQHSQNVGMEPVFKKLGKSIVARKTIEKSQIIDETNIIGRIISGNGVAIRQASVFLGRKVNRKIIKNEPILLNDIE